MSSFDFPSLPGQFAHLRIIAYLRGDTSAVDAVLLLRLNNDTGSNYDWEKTVTAGTGGLSSTVGDAQTSASLVNIPAATAPAGYVGAVTIDIPNYAATVMDKSGIAMGFERNSTSAGQCFLYTSGFQWRSTNAVTRVTILPAAGNFVAGSRVTIYGLA